MALPVMNRTASEDQTETGEGETPTYRMHRRFDRAARLFGEPGLERLMNAHVLVIGVGGVGSFAAEALARSGVGHIGLVDFDKVCITNTNRQLHTMKGTIGKRKVDIMADRLRLIHPTATVTPLPLFYSADSCDQILGPVPKHGERASIDFVIDAIDNITAKVHLIHACLLRGIPMVSAMGAAARMDPSAIFVDDLALTQRDPFARAVRRLLKKKHGVESTCGLPIGVPAVYSMENALAPQPLTYDGGEGFRCVCPGGKNGLNDCDNKSRIDGSASFVTGAFGLTAASVAVRALIAAP